MSCPWSPGPMALAGFTRRATATRFPTLLVALAVSACSDSSGPDTDELTQTEAVHLLSALSAVYLPTPSAPSPTSPAPVESHGPAGAPTTSTESESSSVTVSCVAGGEVLIVTNDTTTITTDFVLDPTSEISYMSSSDYEGRARVSTRYSACASRDSRGEVWTFNADPGLSFAYGFSGETETIGYAGGGFATTSMIDWEGVWDGALDWSNGDRSGTCTVSLNMESHSSVMGGSSTFSYTQSGHICGVEVSASGSSPM